MAGSQQKVWIPPPAPSHFPLSSCIIKPVIAHPSTPFSGARFPGNAPPKRTKRRGPVRRCDGPEDHRRRTVTTPTS